jgi:hypothetical protein
MDLPMASGVVSFEIPEEMAGREVVLIVSSMALGGPYAGECRIGPGLGMGQGPSLLEVGRPIEPRLPSATPDPRDLGEGLPDRDDPGRVADLIRPALRRSFAVLARPGDPAAPSSYDMVEARLRALGDRIQVYVDEDDIAGVGDDVLRAIVSGFEGSIDPVLSPWIGRPIDVDRDGRFAVLISRRVGLPYADRCHVDGYFRGTDLDLDLPRPLSNRADLVYLDAGLRAGPYLETVLAHEYAHAVLASRRLERVGPVPEPAWIDEAMAHLCEDRVARSTTNLDYRVSAFLSDPSRYRLVVDDESRPGLFRSHGNRGASYLFLRWCAATFDLDLPPALAFGRSPAVESLERLTGRPLAELHRRWAVALARGSLDSGADPSVGLDLLDSIGDWPIGGVRFTEVGPDDRVVPFSIEGTGLRFFRLSSDPSGPTRVEFRLDPAAEPTLTALILDDPMPRLALDVSIVQLGPDSATLVARVEDRSGIPVRLDRLSWEPLCPPERLPRVDHRPGQIGEDDLGSLFPGTFLGPRSQSISRRFEIPSAQLRHGPLVFRLTARSERGGRVVSWTDLAPPPPRPPSARQSALADRQSSPGRHPPDAAP